MRYLKLDASQVLVLSPALLRRADCPVHAVAACAKWERQQIRRAERRSGRERRRRDVAGAVERRGIE